LPARADRPSSSGSIWYHRSMFSLKNNRQNFSLKIYAVTCKARPSSQLICARRKKCFNN
jgi:hypothetical protein